MGSGQSNLTRNEVTPNHKRKHDKTKKTIGDSLEPVSRSSVNVSQRKDVMISYSHQDINIMRKLKDLLISVGLTVWVDETGLSPGAAYLREIGEAIVDSLTFVILLSRDSVVSKYCQDEVSLAYISNKNIFAISVEEYDTLAPIMDVGLKLTLSCVQWHIITDGEMSTQLEPVITSIQAAVAKIPQPLVAAEPESDETMTDDEESPKNFVMNRQAFNKRLQRQRSIIGTPDVDENEFWDKHFGTDTEVPWSKFQSNVDSTFATLWEEMTVVEQQKQLLFHLMKKEMRVKKTGILNYKQFKLFCSREGERIPLSEAIQLFAAETYAMKDVFSVNSSVRLSAIGNLGKFQSKAVIDALLDLLENEEDPDVTVVAAITLAHAASGIKSFKERTTRSLLECLSNRDRLVRESGCLALGRMKSKKSIKHLVNLWRNDTISSVREAAQVAINQIGGEEAEQALHITKVLSDEIQLLKTQ